MIRKLGEYLRIRNFQAIFLLCLKYHVFAPELSATIE
jgi:hypothetical protein